MATVLLGGALVLAPAAPAFAKSKGHSGVPACSVISAATVNKYLATKVGNPSGKPGKGSLKNIETCSYAGGNGVSIYYDAGTSKQIFEEALSSLANATSVKGLGSAAYSSQSSNTDPNQNQVTALFGSLEIAVTADASLPNEEALLKVISAKA